MNANETAYKVTISNEDYTDTKHNTTLTGFASVEAASKAAKEAARDIAGELTNVKVIYSETLNAYVVVNPNSGAWLVIAKVGEDNTPVQPATKRITVKRSEWNETAKRLECSGWYYIGTPTATGKTIYRRGNSEVEIIIEEDSPAPEFSELSHAETIARRIEAMKPRGAWNNGVKQYALMLLDWYETEANESSLTLETMLNGAKDWEQYARGGVGVALKDGASIK